MFSVPVPVPSSLPPHFTNPASRSQLLKVPEILSQHSKTLTLIPETSANRPPSAMSRILDGVSSKGGSKTSGVFDLTPHKIAICHLIQVFAPPAQQSVPFPFQSASQHNRLGLFLFSLTRVCNSLPTPQQIFNIFFFRITGEIGQFSPTLSKWGVNCESKGELGSPSLIASFWG